MRVSFLYVLFVLVGLLLSPGVLFARKSDALVTRVPSIEEREITLDKAVEIALNNNLELKALRKNTDIARSNITLADTFTNPEASLNIEQGHKGDLPDTVPKLELEVDKTMRLGSWWFNRKAAKAGYEAAKQALRSQEQTLIRDVKSVFYSLLSLERNLKLTHETILLNDELARVARLRFERGEVSEVEANIFEIERDISSQESKRLEAGYFSEMLRFKNLLGFPSEADIRLKGELFNRELIFSLDELINFALEYRPDLLEVQNRIKQAKAQSTLAKVEAFPPVTVGFRYEQETDGEQLFGAKMGIGIPVFDQNRARIQETKALREQAEFQLRALMLDVFRQIRTAYNNLELLKERIDIYEQKMKPKLEKTLEVYKEAYRNGQVNLFDILINERQYFQAKTNYFSTLNEYDQAAAELERVIGGKLEEFLTKEIFNQGVKKNAISK